MRLTAVVALLLTGLLTADPAQASSMSRDEVLASWTQPTAASTAAWQAARLDRDRWRRYRFDWSSDRCTRAPEVPFGFDFTDACRHHDFGYRNYRAAGTFARHKTRIDEVFRADLRRICDGHHPAVQPVCNTVAFGYFTAVRFLPKT